MNFRASVFLMLLFLIAGNVNAQDMSEAKKIIDTLTCSYFWGRGYTNEGLDKSAKYLATQFERLGLRPVSGKSYWQDFSYPVNTFPGKMELSIDGKQLEPGKDFIVSAESRGIKGSGNFKQKDSTHFVDPKTRVILSLEEKLTWSVSPEQADYTSIQIDKKALQKNPLSYKLNVESKQVAKFKTANVCGFVKGTTKPDSYIVITAHYDHLGGMGNATYFPGANDNASGITMLLMLAKYYAENPSSHSILFILFSGEEAGLIGSKYFTENPLVPLSQIRFLINMDLVGTGEEGITVVNASLHEKEFAKLKQINDANKYLVDVKSRGKAANSDHYWFTEKGVPAFFIYTLGGIKAYHDVFDKAQTLPLTEFRDLYQLVLKFNKEFDSAELPKKN